MGAELSREVPPPWPRHHYWLSRPGREPLLTFDTAPPLPRYYFSAANCRAARVRC
jgi:hypothetical protein